jgi:hypothetical protein
MWMMWVTGDRLAHLHPGAPLLADVVAMHDVEDLVSHSLGIPAPAAGGQHTSHPLLGLPSSLPMNLLLRTVDLIRGERTGGEGGPG